MTPTNFSKQAKINYRQAMTVDFFSYRHDESRHFLVTGMTKVDIFDIVSTRMINENVSR